MTNSNLDKRNSRNYLSLDTPLDVIFSDVYGRMVIQCIREVLKDNSQLGKIILLYILYDIRVQLYKIEVTSQDAHWVAVTTWLIHYYYTYTNL